MPTSDEVEGLPAMPNLEQETVRLAPTGELDSGSHCLGVG